MHHPLCLVRRYLSSSTVSAKLPQLGHHKFFGTFGTSYQVPAPSATACPKLPTAYYCQDKWDTRLQTPIMKKVELEDFFYHMDLKYQSDKLISPIDVDLYVNKVTEDENLEEMEELIHRLRKSPSTIDMLPSTPHAVVRALLQLDKIDMLLRILNDRFNYGIFLDNYTANILMDKLLSTGNYKDAARIASLLMLQEDFGPPITKFFAIFACLRLLVDEIPQGSWEPLVEEAEESADEEVRVRVKYLRNPYFDDHFELTESQSIVGKTLAYAAMHIQEDETLQNSISLYGCALYDKWLRVEHLLTKLGETKKPIYAEVVTKVTALAETRHVQMEALPDKKLPYPSFRQAVGVNLEPATVTAALERQNWDAQTSVPLPRVRELLASSVLNTTDDNLLSKVRSLLEQAIKESSTTEVEEIGKCYEHWKEQRIVELDKQIERFKEIQLLLSHQEMKKDLKEREDTIFFFDHEEEWMMKLEEKEGPLPPRERRVIVKLEPKMNRKKKDLIEAKPKGIGKKEDDSYVSPIM